jgi:Tol biopolymer transport system component
VAKRLGLSCLVAAAATLASIASPADGAFPGQNGLIAFSSDRDGNDEVYTMGPEGTGVTRLTNFIASDDLDAAWSPDGQRIAFRANRAGPYEIYVMNADGTGQTKITTNTAGIQPAWSPDGEKIAFTFNSTDEIYVMNADGTGLTNVTNHQFSDTSPAWSPDGQRIVFTSGRDGSREIYAMNSDGTGQTNITNHEFLDDSATWSPNAQKIAFTTNRDGNYEIYTMSPDGTDQTRLTDNGVTDYQPAWSPDGSQIAFTSDEGGDNEIYVMKADGSLRHAITGNTANDRLPDWQPIPVTGYARPKGATPDYFSLVVAYDACASPNRQHGAPLDVDSCNPPVQASDYLTVGTLDANEQAAKSVGSVYASVKVGNPVTPADEADVKLNVSVKDVRLASDLSDYAGELQVSTLRRITDKDNTPNPGGPGPGTTTDVALAFTVPCLPTGDDTTIGSLCSIITTADTLVPGQVKEERRSIWQLDQMRVYDGGADGDADTAGDNTLFMSQGVFAP